MHFPVPLFSRLSFLRAEIAFHLCIPRLEHSSYGYISVVLWIDKWMNELSKWINDWPKSKRICFLLRTEDLRESMLRKILNLF